MGLSEELQGLQKLVESNAISQSEYEDLKQQVINNYKEHGDMPLPTVLSPMIADPNSAAYMKNTRMLATISLALIPFVLPLSLLLPFAFIFPIIFGHSALYRYNKQENKQGRAVARVGAILGWVYAVLFLAVAVLGSIFLFPSMLDAGFTLL